MLLCGYVFKKREIKMYEKIYFDFFVFFDKYMGCRNWILKYLFERLK